MQFDVAWIRKRTWFNVPKYLFSAVAIHLQWLIGSVLLCRLSVETPFRGKTRTNQRKLVLDGDEHRRHLAMSGMIGSTAAMYAVATIIVET